MGYCMEQQASSFYIKAENKQKALEAIQALAYRVDVDGSGGSYSGGQKTEAWYSWVTTKEFFEAKTLPFAVEAWRWQIIEDAEGNVVDIDFNGEKLGDDDAFLHAIAPYVEANSFIEMSGEDGALWRWVFDGDEMEEKQANISWN
jgi:hypothetical protein